MEKTNIKALFFDVDGTLMGYISHRIHPDDFTSLRELHEKGYKLFIASGRDLYVPAERSILTPVLPYLDGFISANGQRCYLSDGTVISYHPLPAEDFVPIREICRENHIAILYYIGHESFVTELSEHVQAFADHVDIPVPPVRPIDPSLTEPQKICLYISPEDEDRLLGGLRKHTYSARNTEHLIDLIPQGVGKDSGIREICSSLGIDPKETMAFGDGENDLSMMAQAGISIAMGNADECVKASADHITDSSEDGGITKALKHFGLL